MNDGLGGSMVGGSLDVVVFHVIFLPVYGTALPDYETLLN